MGYIFNKKVTLVCILSFILCFQISCQVYKSVGRKDFESDAPSRVASKPRPNNVNSLNTLDHQTNDQITNQLNCWTQSYVNDVDPINTYESTLIEKSDTQEIWQNSDSKIITIKKQSENLYEICTQ